MTSRLRWHDIELIRTQRRRSTLLFITDRCPVECAHCSVDSRRDSPTITDYVLFEQIVDELCAQPELEVVGISGGEPFVEKRGLTLAVERLHAAGKRIVVYTSGHWAIQPEPPKWIASVLDKCETVFLSTDAFHAEKMPDERYVNAARAIAAAGAWIVVQVIDADGMRERAESLLRDAFGADVDDRCEVRPTFGLSAGRGADVFTITPRHRGRDFSPCTMVASPMIRYDGVVTGCCNETVIMGGGPKQLRVSRSSGRDVTAAVESFHADPMLRAIGSAGPGALTDHPRFADLADRKFSTVCDLCWTMLDRVADDIEPDPLIGAVSGVLLPLP